MTKISKWSFEKFYYSVSFKHVTIWGFVVHSLSFIDIVNQQQRAVSILRTIPTNHQKRARTLHQSQRREFFPPFPPFTVCCIFVRFDAASYFCHLNWLSMKGNNWNFCHKFQNIKLKMFEIWTVCKIWKQSGNMIKNRSSSLFWIANLQFIEFWKCLSQLQNFQVYKSFETSEMFNSRSRELLKYLKLEAVRNETEFHWPYTARCKWKIREQRNERRKMNLMRSENVIWWRKSIKNVIKANFSIVRCNYKTTSELQSHFQENSLVCTIASENFSSRVLELAKKTFLNVNFSENTVIIV